ncbi:MAG TPA: sigma-70 family RNA polymerase sigma factor [Pirellulales bacterium]|nr:sigma-70 family RNA polymerase sigma factor [Pirellulales bacterium]
MAEPTSENNPQELAACVTGARHGDADASRLLIERLYPLVAKVVRAYLPRHAGHEDAIQEVFLRVFARLDQFRSDAPIEHWVARIAVRVSIDQLRRSRRRRELCWADLEPRELAVLSETIGAASGLAAVDRVATRELIDKLLGTLSPDDRVVITMLDLQQRSVAEVAQLTERSRVAVKVRAMRARRKLRRVLSQLLAEQPTEPATGATQP